MAPLISVENLKKSFNSVPALRGVTFDINASELTVIIGPSGCGKSTLLRCLNGLETFDEGKVRIGDTVLELTDKDSHNPARFRQLREEVGMVFQSFNLFPHLTVLENIALAPTIVKHDSKKVARDNASELAAKVGLFNRIDYYPSQLSGGQQQRAAIARALAMRPKVMLYDEPTSALDPSLTGEVLNIMKQLNDEGMTQIVVTHEMKFAREVSDNVLVFFEGEIIESGSPDNIFTSPSDTRTRNFLSRYL